MEVPRGSSLCQQVGTKSSHCLLAVFLGDEILPSYIRDHYIYIYIQAIYKDPYEAISIMEGHGFELT